MSVRRLVVLIGLLFLAATAHAQVNTGSIAGTVTDTSGAVLPGVNVSLNGERLIGGQQLQVTDAGGTYRFDRLPPGAYQLKFELAGFRTVEQTDVRISAAFIATSATIMSNIRVRHRPMRPLLDAVRNRIAR